MKRKLYFVLILVLFIIFSSITGYNFYIQYKNRPPKIIQAPKIVVTLPEGTNNEQMADILASKLPLFNKQEFLNNKNNIQGYLFPDTYFFTERTNTEEVSKTLNTTFNRKIKELQPSIDMSGKSLSDIIIMASILEEEANGPKDIGVISGILWKRMSIGIPLQVDVSPITYKEKGLPKLPLSNPGLLALQASISSVASPYLYYLHDKSGQVYYARNYNEHRKNIKNYLK